MASSGVRDAAARIGEGQGNGADLAETLARAGYDLLSLRSTRDLLERLCRLTVEVLQCDCSLALVRDREGNAYVPVASAGLGSEEAEKIDSFVVTNEALTGPLSGLQQDEAVQVLAEQKTAAREGLPHPCGMTVTLLMALRRGGNIVALQTAAYRGRQDPFTPNQVLTARALGRLASMALEYTRRIDEVTHVSRLKSELVATMSHALRTPLHVIVGYNDLLLEGVLGDLAPEQAESLQHVSERARELLDLITATLTLTQLEGGTLPEDVDVALLVHELEAEFARRRRDVLPQPVWHVQPGLPALRTDRAKLTFVVESLVDNAVRFTHPDGKVHVDVQDAAAGIEFSVSDTGIGIDPELIPTIFDTPSGLDTTAGGHGGQIGLTLYTVGRLVEMLGGKITLTSRPDHGSTVRVWLPPEWIAPDLLPNRSVVGKR